MTLSESVKSCFRNYRTFSGRATRSEFWKFILFMLLGLIVCIIVNSVVFGSEITATYNTDANGQPVGDPISVNRQYNDGILGDIFFLICALPWLAVTWRRLHDSGRPGYLHFLSLFIWQLVFLAVMIIATGPSEFWQALQNQGQVRVSFQSPAAAVALVLGFFLSIGFNIYWLTRPSAPGENQYGLPPGTDINEEVFS